MALAGKTLFMTGGSRGIGLQIALRAAADGANVCIAAKTADAHPSLPGTIHTAAAEIEAAGGRALAIQTDIRDQESIVAAVDQCAEHFGGLDILVNNASAISNTGTEATTPRKFDLMMGVNLRGTFFTTQAAVKHLRRSDNPHVLAISPPLNLDPEWLVKAGTAYTMAKYGMSFCMLGMAEEFKADGIACNGLWPRTGIATAAIEMLTQGQGAAACRTPAVMADAAHAILQRKATECTGNFFIDDEVLRAAGATDADIDAYAVQPGVPLMPDFFLGPVSDFEAWEAKVGAKVL